MKSATQRQDEYYQNHANSYDSMHLHSKDMLGHNLALALAKGFCEGLNIKSILDVGTGTGRGIRSLASIRTTPKIVGIDRSLPLLRKAYDNCELPPCSFLQGNANALPFPDESFDLTIALGLLHHVPNPNQVIKEMFRVSNRAVIISDSNNFGQGTLLARAVKQALFFFRLWRVFDFFRTRGRGYMYSKGDGIFYSYSLFSALKLLKSESKMVYFVNTQPASANFFRSAPGVAAFCVKG